MHDFSSIAALPAGSTRLVTLGIDFGDSTQNISFDLVASGRPIKVNLRPSVGELLRPVGCTEGFFMNEQGTTFSIVQEFMYCNTRNFRLQKLR